MTNSTDDITDNDQTNQAFQPTTMSVHHRHRVAGTDQKCKICGSKAIGMNFGALTCAPCKAFFRRNARRQELLKFPCRHQNFISLMNNIANLNRRTIRYLQKRRCSSCRLRRCFDVGMKKELVRTDEENERYKQLVDLKRNQREILKQQLQEIKNLAIPLYVFNNSALIDEIDWRHLSNIVYAYDTYCLKTFIEQRGTMVFGGTTSTSNDQTTNRNPTGLTMSIVISVSSFLRSLPVFHSLPRTTRTYLCKTNIRPLIFPTIHELNQSCFSEPWQVASYNATWELMCGADLYIQFEQAERMATKLLITDPVVTRLFIITLFFFTPLHYHHDCATPTPILKKKSPIYHAQNGYTTLLCKYLSHRHGEMEAARIYSNLIFVYLKMQLVGFGIYTHLRTQKDLMPTNETLSKMVALDVNDA